MKDKKLSLLGMGIIILAIVVISGCTSTSIGKSTYTTNGMTFNYPNDFINTTSPPAFINSTSGWTQIGFLASQNVYITIGHNPNSNKSTTSSGELLTSEKVVRQNNGNVLSTTNQTNPNGVVVYGESETFNEPHTNNKLRYYEMYFTAKNGEVYEIVVYGLDSDNSQISNVKNIIFNSLKVT